MYDELIKALHEGAEFLECSTPGIKNSFAKMCHNAADAIEELTAYVRREDGGKLMIPWIYSDLDTIIDSYSEPPKEE